MVTGDQYQVKFFSDLQNLVVIRDIRLRPYSYLRFFLSNFFCENRDLEFELDCIQSVNINISISTYVLPGNYRSLLVSAYNRVFSSDVKNAMLVH